MTEADRHAPTTRLLDRPVHPDVRLRLLENADGVIERLAEEYRLSTFDVTRALPETRARFADGSLFEVVMGDLSTWGEVLVIVHTPDIVLEVKSIIPPGSTGRGYFNVHGDCPMGGHIKADRCEAIAFVSRPFMGRPSASVQFFSRDGDAMFKVFVRRDEARELDEEQLLRFESLRERLCQ